MSEKLTKIQVHNVAMTLLDKLYPTQYELYGQISKGACLAFIHELGIALEKQIEINKEIEACGQNET